MRRHLCVFLMLLAPVSGFAQSAPPDKPAEPPKQDTPTRPTGLPSGLTWTFNFDAGWGTFGFANSLYLNPRNPGITENFSDQWFEGYLKPTLSTAYTFASSSQFYGKISGVGERTYGTVPPAFGRDTSSFQVEDLAFGWRSGASLSLGDDVLDFTVGRAPYQVGHGFLLYDGAAEGGSRGGYWTNARRAFEFAAIARFTPGAHTIEGFYLDRDDLPEREAGNRLSGVNYEFTIGDDDATTTLGATYMKWSADPQLEPGRDGLNVFNVRAYTAPLPSVPDLSFEFEYASERNGQTRTSDAWSLLGAYQFSTVRWTPQVSYRYAFFEGDDPSTAANEAFDPLFPGFSDWGSWWQGEIAGEYFLSNSNLKSHQVRVHVEPTATVSGGVILYDFRIDQPGSYGPTVTADGAAVEVDLYTDWKVNTNFTVSFLGAFANPGTAVQQFSGRTKNFTYGMVYIAYSF